jgi:hypothetical protein
VTRTAAVIVALALAGCGSDRYAAERDKVEQLVPGAEDVECAGEPRTSVSCEGTLDGRPLHCEFRFVESGDARAYSGSHSCWQDRGRR